LEAPTREPRVVLAGSGVEIPPEEVGGVAPVARTTRERERIESALFSPN